MEMLKIMLKNTPVEELVEFCEKSGVDECINPTGDLEELILKLILEAYGCENNCSNECVIEELTLQEYLEVVKKWNEKAQMKQMSVKVVINKFITISEEDVIVEFYTDKENKLGILLTKKIKKDNLIISKKVKKEIDIKDGEYSFIFTKNGNKIKNEVMLIASSEDTKDTKDVLIKIEKMEKINL